MTSSLLVPREVSNNESVRERRGQQRAQGSGSSVIAGAYETRQLALTKRVRLRLNVRPRTTRLRGIWKLRELVNHDAPGEVAFLRSDSC
jgi:hypothetical protein